MTTEYASEEDANEAAGDLATAYVADPTGGPGHWIVEADWKWNADVGAMPKHMVLQVGLQARIATGNEGSCLVIYEPGDMTRYEVLFTRNARTLLCSQSDQPTPDRDAYYASIVNMGGAYVLGGGWKSWDYVQEHWRINGRPMGEMGAKALANLFNAFEGQL